MKYCADSSNYVTLLSVKPIEPIVNQYHGMIQQCNHFWTLTFLLFIFSIHTLYFTSGSVFFFVSAPSVLWLSETGGELIPSVLDAWGSDAVLDGWEGACSWYKRFLSFSSKVLIVRSTNSTLRGPSLSDSPGPPLVGCWWFWWAGLWGWEVIVPGCMGMA